MKVKVEITLDVPDDMKGIGRWESKKTIVSYIEHWLYEGMYTCGYSVELPDGIQCEGFELEFQK